MNRDVAVLRLYFFIKKIQMNDIFHACRVGDLTLLHQLVAQRPELVNEVSPKGYPPLVLATYSDQLEVAAYLLDHEANVDLRDASGNTALMGAVFKRLEKQITLLLQNGADTNMQNHNGATALTYAATFGNKEITQQLLLAGANPALADVRELTPLAHARNQGNKEVIELLEAYENQ